MLPKSLHFWLVIIEYNIKTSLVKAGEKTTDSKRVHVIIGAKNTESKPPQPAATLPKQIEPVDNQPEVITTPTPTTPASNSPKM